jgi:arylsulfatase A-like enzyme
MNKYYLILIGCLLLLNACTNKSENSIPDSPNIILIITDDQGYGDFGFYGNPHVRTPFLDSLARMSTRFNQFYVCPVCAPTRAGLMTGRYALHTGVYDTYNGGAIMHADEVTLAEILKDAGYVTGIFGKWHLGDSYPFRPGDQGFKTSLVHRAGGIGQPGDHFGNFTRPDSSYFNPVLLRDGKEINTKGFCSDVFTRAAIEFIEEHCSDEVDQPFFLYLAYNAPHTPLQLPGEYLEMYKDINISSGDYPDRGRFPDMNAKDIEDARRVYGMVTNIDDNLQLLFNKLTELEMIERTLIVFLTDNGPQQRRYTAGFRERKGSVYEGGIRVPSFWYWKGNLTGNFEINDPAANIDVLPTILDLCGIDLPTGLDLDGRSLAALLRGEVSSLPERTLFFEWQRGFTEPYRNIAVRKGDYKMVGNIEYPEDPAGLELYHISDDPYELNDISKENTEMIHTLKSEFDRWYSEVIANEKLVTPPRIIIGSDNENPVILNRNDWKGAKAKQWGSADAYGYWDVTFAADGLYNVKLQFADHFSREGRIFIRAGTVRRSLVNQDTTTNRLLLPDVPFREGDYMLEAWYDSWGKVYTPMYVEIEKSSE